jgi:O-antigen/teichoic acid export membrane protein
MTSLLRRWLGELSLLRSSAIVLAGTASARLLGFLFLVAAARLLEPGDYGTLAYALAILQSASILLTNAPGGLARFLARSMDDRERQEYCYTNWAATTGALLLGSVVLLLPFAPLTGLGILLIPALIINLANIAIFENYQETQRGLGRFTVMGVYYTLANLLQLVAILIAGAIGLRSAPLFLALYGFSAMAALGVMRLVAPTPLGLRLATVNVRQMVRIARYIAPIVLQGICYAFWWGSDLILIDRLLTPLAAGNYAAGKTVTQVLILGPTAIALAAGPSLSRLAESALRRRLLQLVCLGALAIIPPAALLAIIQQPLMHLLYGNKYPHDLDAFNALVIGISLYGFFVVVASVWGALGRPFVGAIGTGCGMVVTVTLGFVLIPRLGLLGGGIAFAAGAGAQLLFITVFTAWGLYSGGTTKAKLGHLSDDAFLAPGG